MVMKAEVNETLELKLGRWRKALSDAATGPLLIASEVVSLASHWEDVRAQAGDVACTSWLRAQLGPGKGLAYFEARHDAVKKLGEACRRTMHHDVAVWISNNVPEQYLGQVKLAMMRGARDQNSNPLTLAQARSRIREIIGAAAPRARVCRRCADLEKALRDAGIDVPE